MPQSPMMAFCDAAVQARQAAAVEVAAQDEDAAKQSNEKLTSAAAQCMRDGARPHILANTVFGLDVAQL